MATCCVRRPEVLVIAGIVLMSVLLSYAHWGLEAEPELHTGHWPAHPVSTHAILAPSDVAASDSAASPLSLELLDQREIPLFRSCVRYLFKDIVPPRSRRKAFGVDAIFISANPRQPARWQTAKQRIMDDAGLTEADNVVHEVLHFDGASLSPEAVYCALADNITSPDAGALSLSLKNLFAHYVCALYEYDAIMILDDDAMFPHGPRPVEDAIRFLADANNSRILTAVSPGLETFPPEQIEYYTRRGNEWDALVLSQVLDMYCPRMTATPVCRAPSDSPSRGLSCYVSSLSGSRKWLLLPITFQPDWQMTHMSARFAFHSYWTSKLLSVDHPQALASRASWRLKVPAPSRAQARAMLQRKLRQPAKTQRIK